MFKDRQQELERLQDALWEDDILDKEPAPKDDDLLSEEMLDQLLGFEVRSYNADRVDVDTQAFSQEVLQEEPKLTGLLITAGLLTLGIFLVICWWVLRYLGVIG